MGIFSLFKKSKINSEIQTKPSSIENKNWVKVEYSYEVVVESNVEEKKIREHLAKECTELLFICLNQKQLRTDDGEILGHLNPYLQGEYFSYRGPLYKGMHSKGLNRLFIPKIKKEKSNIWRITIKPQKNYSPLSLIKDMPSLVDLKMKLEQILDIPNKQDGFVTPILDFDKNKNPMYKELRGEIFLISCKVKDRLKLSKSNKKLDKELFNGEEILEFIQEIKNVKSKKKKFSKWIKEVDKLQ